MGFRISSLKSIPECFGCYFFLIGNYDNSTMVNDLFTKEFHIVSDRIGRDNAVIQNTKKGAIEWELSKALHHRMETKSVLSEYILEFESGIPGLLILWKHPNKLTDKDSVVHIPFQVLDETYSNTNELLRDLIDFAEKKNNNLINKVKRKHKVIKGLSFSVNIGVFALNIEL